MTAAAVLYVKDLASMCAFYETCFAMVPIDSADGFSVLESSDWELSLVSAPSGNVASGMTPDPPDPREQTPIKLAFEVTDLEEAGVLVVKAGGGLQPAHTVWEYRGRRHLDCLDPEGNVVQLRQPIAQ